MARYRKLGPQIWNDAQFREMPTQEKLAWVYLLTGPNTNAIGLYHLPIEQMPVDLGMSAASVRSSIGKFEKATAIHYDSSTGLLWIPGWLEDNAPAGINQAKGYVSIGKEYLPHRFAKAFSVPNGRGHPEPARHIGNPEQETGHRS